MRPVLRDVARVGVALPCAAALALFALASLFPLRLDQRNFQDLRRAAELDLPRGLPVLFVSAGDDAASYRFAGYALHNLAYPRMEALWLHLGPRAAPGRGLRLGDDGRVWRAAAAGEAEDDAARLETFVRDGVVLYDDEATRAEAERRQPRLAKAERVAVVAAPGPSFVPRAPSSEISLTRVARLSALFGVVVCAGALLSTTTGAALAWSAAPALAAAALLVALSGAQALPLRSPGAWPYLLWLAGLVALTARLRGGANVRRPAPGRAGACLLVVALACAALIAVIRLDFDEDAHSHWLLQARAYFDHGRHVPEALRAGHVHAATYPYGWSALLALAAWAADLPPSRFLWLDAPTSLALLFYRLGLCALGVGTLGLLGAHLRDLAPISRLPLLGVALAVALFPILQGRHVAAETLLLPLMAGALVLVARGERATVAAGLFIGAAATLVKLEAGLLFALVVLPWLAARRGLLRREGLLALALGLAPTVVWRATLGASNAVYVAPTPAALLQALPLAPRVAFECAQVVLKDDLAWPFLALLLAALWRLRTRGPEQQAWRELAVPASVFVAAAALGSIYLFTTLPRAWQIEVSYARLLLLPLFSALLFALETLARDEAGAAAA